MEEATKKAQTLIEAMPYILNFKDKFVVVKYGGSVMREPRLARSILEDIVFMSAVGIRVILIHGGGPRISEALATKEIKTRFLEGLRYTDAETIAVIKETLLSVNQELIYLITELGGKAKGVFPEDRTLGAVKFSPTEANLGLVGEIKEINTSFFEETCRTGIIPVVIPLAFGADGLLYNINADAAASKIAVGLSAEKLVFLTDQAGIMRDRSNEESLISILRPSQAKALVEEEIITAGMLPKVRAGLFAMENGVAKVHLVGGHIPHTLLLEIFTSQGVGTEIVPE
ncbi:MAG: acetylglutamate kinase [Candidatus Omnitrophota bacterium]